MARFKKLISHLWASTSDYPIDQDQIDWRAKAWAVSFGESLFDKYLKYKIKACFISRAHRGPVHVDEFIKVHKAVSQGLVWSTSQDDWVNLDWQIQNYYFSLPEYEIQRQAIPDIKSAPPAVWDRIKAQIYGWEE